MGKMGQAISDLLALDHKSDFHVFPRLTPDNQATLKECEVVIEFTTSEAAPGIIRTCIEAGIPIVSGTTGWQEYHLKSVKNLCLERKGKFLYASNFSIGMNIVFALNRKLASILHTFPQFEASILEKHHIHKKDSPSGTAFSLIDGIIESHSRYNGFTLNTHTHEPDKIATTAIREGDIKGYHEVAWDSGSERILISHEAFDRRIFAEGAVLGATWLKKQPPGFYTMKDIIDV